MSVILCTAGYDHTIRFWEALSGICSRTIQHPDSQVNRLCITPDKRYLAAAGHNNVKLYDIKSTNPNPVMTFDGHTNNITGVAFHCEGKWMVTSSEDGTVKVWDTRTGSLQRNYAHKAPVNDVVIHPNQGELISGDRAGIVRVWDLGESVCTHQLIPEDDVAVHSVSVASDGSLLCAGNKKGNVYIWRMIQDAEITRIVPICTFQAHKDYLTRVLLSPDVKHLATCSADHTAKVWNLDLDYPPAKLAAATAAAKAKAKGLSSSETSDTPSSPESPEHLNHVSPNGAEVEVNPFSLFQGATPPVNNEPQQTFPVQPDGPPMDSATGTLFLETTLANHQRWVWDCAFSADSAYLVTVSSDHYARLWELASGQIIRQYSGHHRGAVCVALNDYSEPR
ncbi:WD40 repeat domain-containing protein [Aspergillus ibericus CBS 121593]|uniref:Target of rapamycin complex subunit LST8 n=1 Tax=Aspergillus ibericus CBS 121593 TaxID=1448316 RepID=A0A395GXN0_9EURO|nr:WD40 repeat-like protein [Aspergillus ibericus CBS 121593]RAL00307.1 WD40 repeat-like protein [Aspergillus ibericus CBS 121593]